MAIYAIGSVAPEDLSDCVLFRDENRKSPLFEFNIRGFRFIAEFRHSCCILSSVHAQLSVPSETEPTYGFERREDELARLPYAPGMAWRGGYMSAETATEIVANAMRFAIGQENASRRNLLHMLCAELARKADAPRVVAANDRDREQIQISAVSGNCVTISYSSHPNETAPWGRQLLRFVKETLVTPSMDGGGHVQISGDVHEAPDSGHLRMAFAHDLLRASGLAMSDIDQIAGLLND